MCRKTAIIVPTGSEAESFSRHFPCRIVEIESLTGYCSDEIPVVIGGVGMASTAASTVRLIREYSPGMIIMAGVAGAYPHAGLNRGECFVVSAELVADQGAFRNGGFTPLYRKKFLCPAAETVACLPPAASNTVNCAGAGYVGEITLREKKAELENMEGAAFFAVCTAAGVDFLEVRAVSNLTTDSRSDWKMEEAVEVLGAGLKRLLDEING